MWNEADYQTGPDKNKNRERMEGRCVSGEEDGKFGANKRRKKERQRR
jgi:hypothetical protein